jgi:alpha-N-arabinofuranosidase
LTIDPAFSIGEVDRRLFGSFVEHMGRCVYEGIYEPGHPLATGEGFRKDVLELSRELGVSLVRYPGGNFVSGYQWEDGVGPVADRPTRLDLAWRSIETNAFGMHEFMSWAAQAGVEPMLAVNLGTRGVKEAADLVEYSNFPGGTQLSDLRRRNGAQDPFGIKLWCLGNEMDGPWQVGHKSADDYGKLAAQTAQAMRLVDPDIELVACGSSSRAMPTFASWEATVLEHTYDHVDYVSLHAYYENHDDAASFLASAVDMDAFIDELVATCDHVKARLRSKKVLKLSFDEWNVWYQKGYQSTPKPVWEEAPHLIEDDYSVLDAVVVGSYLISLLNHADRVTVACQAQLVNIIAPIRTEKGGPAWRQTIFYPFAQVARHARGQALVLPLVSPQIGSDAYGTVPAVTCAATIDPQHQRLALFLVNRDQNGPIELEVDLRSVGAGEILTHSVLSDPDMHAANSATNPDRVTPKAGDGAVIDGGRLRTVLPPVSFSTLVIGTT